MRVSKCKMLLCLHLVGIAAFATGKGHNTRTKLQFPDGKKGQMLFARLLLLALIIPGAVAFSQIPFAAPVSYSVTIQQTGLAAADLNGDGLPDIVAKTQSGLAVLMNNGDGTLQPPSLYSASVSTTPIVIDLNGDGKPDVVFGGGGGIGVMLNTGNGGALGPPAYYQTGTGNIQYTIAAGDFYHTGHVDIALGEIWLFGCCSSQTIFKNRGDGTFAIGLQQAGIPGGGQIIAVDVNSDGYADLVSADANGNNVVAVQVNKGNGTFAEAVIYPNVNAGNIASADLNNDGKPDLVILGTAIGVLINKGDGTFLAPVIYNFSTYTPGIVPGYITLADFDGDGKVDIAAFGYSQIEILLGKGDGTFNPPSTVISVPLQNNAPGPLIAADLDGNGDVDLIASDNGGNNVWVVLSKRLPPANLGLRLSTNQGGNAGSVTVTIFGRGLLSGDAVTLRCPGSADIVGSTVSVNKAGTALTTIFNLSGANPGPCSVFILEPNNSQVSVPEVFTIMSGGSSNIWLDIIGRQKIGQGIASPYYVFFGNSGAIDAYDYLLSFYSPNFITMDAGCSAPSPDEIGLTATGPIWCSIPLTYPSGGNNVLPIWLYDIPSGQVLGQPVTLTLNDAPGPAHTSFTALNVTLNGYSSEFAANGDLNLIPTSPIAQTFINAAVQVIDGSGAAANLEAGHTANTQVFTPQSSTDPYTKEQDQLENNLKKVVNFCGSSFIVNTLCGAVFGKIGALFGLQAAAFGSYTAAEAEAGLIAIGTALPAIDKEKSEVRQAAQIDEFVTPDDPNELDGPSGFGVSRWVSAARQLYYAIFFANIASANAPAQNVVVTNLIDTDLDLATLNVQAINLPTQIVPGPFTFVTNGMKKAFSTTVDLRPAQSLLVAINCSLDLTTRILTFTFTSIDPTTGLPPTDPEVGFLAPAAEASIAVSVLPQSSITTGAIISNQAAVVFNFNPTENTNSWANTIDATAPKSEVAALAPTQGTHAFSVQWSGTDVGAGIEDFTIYVSDNGALFKPWLTNTTATQAAYSGISGHTYAFYSIARDLVGNVESGKTAAEAATRVLVDTTPPTIVPQVTGTLGNNGWYRGNVTVSWSVSDPESGIASSTGCTQTVLTNDIAGVTLSCSATNGAGLSTTVGVTIMIDKMPPVISVMPEPGCSLWPPTGKLIQVATVTAADALSGLAPGSLQVTGSSNEPSNDPKSPEIVITPNGSGGYSVSLQADRLGNGTGRVYTLTATASDVAGNTATVNATCSVPHDQGN